MTAILWYLHDHGRGHLERARAVLPHLRSPVVVAAGPAIAAAARDMLDVEVVALPSDTDDGHAHPRGPWHHAPSGSTLRRRTLAIADIVARHSCSTAVIDVSMEVTVLTCLLGLRTIAVRQSGRRDDEAHRIGLDSADIVWVPQHRALEPVDGAVDSRWHFTGPFSRFDNGAGPSVIAPASRRRAVLLLGTGGSGFDEDEWLSAAAPCGWDIVIAGSRRRWAAGGVTAAGRVDPVFPLLQRADVVVTSAGWSAVADTVAAGRRLVLVAEQRPFDEQAVRTEALVAAGLAHGLAAWPTPDELGAVLDAALDLDPSAWSPFHDGCGAQRAATMIDQEHAG